MSCYHMLDHARGHAVVREWSAPVEDDTIYDVITYVNRARTKYQLWYGDHDRWAIWHVETGAKVAAGPDGYFADPAQPAGTRA